jgi:multicomponent Na+:H+ antiporter subunit G
MTWAHAGGGLLLALGSLLLLIGGIGINRLPDFYSRLHAAGMVDTLAAALLLAGMAPAFGLTLGTFKLALILVFLFFTSPTACHALARAAHGTGSRTPDPSRETPPSPS